MRSTVLAVSCSLLLLWSFALSAQTTEAKRAAISGIVVKSNSTEPVKKARVTLSPADDRMAEREPLTAVTDATGKFEFPSVAPGEYRAIASRSGFAPHHYGAGQLVKVRAGEQIRELTLRIAPTAAITGRVLDEDGEPLANVSVMALQYRYMLTSRQMFPVGSAQTDDRGEYRIADLRPGRYYVQASGFTAEAPKGMRYGVRYYPDAASSDAASFLQVRGGDEAEASFHLVPGRTVTVKGTIAGFDPKRQYNVFIGPRTAGFAERGNASGDVKDGAFVVQNVLPGSYTLYGSSFRVADEESVRVRAERIPEFSLAQQDIEVGDTDIEGIRLSFAGPSVRPTPIAGQIKLESANPRTLEELRVGAQPVQFDNLSTLMTMAQGGTSTVKKDGTFALQLTSGAHYYTNLYASNQSFADFYTKSVTYGERDVTASGFVVTSAPGRLMIVIADDGARIEGIVVDQENHPFPNATVIAVPEEQYRNWYEDYGRAETDQNGRFTMRGLRPGDYKLFAWEYAEDGSFMDPDFIRLNDQFSTTVHAKAGGANNLTLKLIPSDEQ